MNELLNQELHQLSDGFTIGTVAKVLCHQEVEGLIGPAVKGIMHCEGEKGHQGPCVAPERGPVSWIARSGVYTIPATWGNISVTYSPGMPPGKIVIK